MPSGSLRGRGRKQNEKIRWRGLSRNPTAARVFSKPPQRRDPPPPGVVTTKIPEWPKAGMHTGSGGSEFLRAFVMEASEKVLT